MTRLQQCIDALEAAKTVNANFRVPGTHALTTVRNNALEQAIAIISRILSAEPTSEEIERVAKAIHYAAFGNQTKLNQQDKKYAKAALLTAFPQQDKL